MQKTIKVLKKGKERILTVGPSPHLRGYVSLSITTRFILATIPWSQLAMVEVVIKAIPENIKDKANSKTCPHYNSHPFEDILGFTLHLCKVKY